MKRKKALLLAMASLIIIGIPLFTKASEIREVSSIKSTGNIVYKSSAGSVELYAEDIAFLQERLNTIPDEIFSPTIYSHIHNWEYFDIKSKSHTKHCAVCGDVIEKHKASRISPCTISYDGEEYPGIKKICSCGYEWEEEEEHNLVYASENDSSHMVSCALSGTSYCSGMDALEEEHSMIYSETDELHHMEHCAKCGFTDSLEKEHSMIYNATDKSHHIGFCVECDFEEEEQECSFEEEGEDQGEIQGEIRKYCKCGNYITETVGSGEPLPEVPDSDEIEEAQEDNLTEKVIDGEGGNL